MRTSINYTLTLIVYGVNFNKLLSLCNGTSLFNHEIIVLKAKLMVNNTYLFASYFTNKYSPLLLQRLYHLNLLEISGKL